MNAVTNLFGIADSKNSGYLDLGANIDIATGLTLNINAGRQQVKNNSASSYTDWKIGVSKDFSVLTGAVAVVGTNANETSYASPANGKFLGKTARSSASVKRFNGGSGRELRTDSRAALFAALSRSYFSKLCKPW